MSKVILLKQNSHEIRQKLRDAGIGVCICASFSDSDWLDFHPGISGVHGIGYPCEGMTKEQTISFIEYEWQKYNTEVVECKDVEEFIHKIKESKV